MSWSLELGSENRDNQWECTGLSIAVIQPIPALTDLLVDIPKLPMPFHFNARLTDFTLALAMIPPTLYYSKVGLELGKLVFRGQNMSPP